MKHTLTFPTPAKDEAPFEEFTYEVDGQRFTLPLFTDVVHSMGVDRRLLDAGLTEDVGARIMVALQVGHQDDARALRMFDYLAKDQQVELFKQWGEFTGAELPES